MTMPMVTFAPLFKELVWGGRNLERVLGKSLPPDVPIGESWELCDLPDAQTPVADGPLSGTTLAALCAAHGADLLGEAQLLEGRFPLLFKFIDAQDTLSVQVHPDEAACARIGGGARPKTEAWHIVSCAPGAQLYAGLRDGVTRTDFERALQDGAVADLLHPVAVQPGDTVFLPAGTVHAIGAGIVLAEVQQSSATTYRVFDWNRVGLDGRPRQLHVEEAMQAIRFDWHGVPPMEPPASGRPGVDCPYFCMEVLSAEAGHQETVSHTGPVVFMGVGGDGSVDVVAGDEAAVVARGKTLLVPACRADAVRLQWRGAARLLAVQIR